MRRDCRRLPSIHDIVVLGSLGSSPGCACPAVCPSFSVQVFISAGRHGKRSQGECPRWRGLEAGRGRLFTSQRASGWQVLQHPRRPHGVSRGHRCAPRSGRGLKTGPERDPEAAPGQGVAGHPLPFSPLHAACFSLPPNQKPPIPIPLLLIRAVLLSLHVHFCVMGE